MPYGISGALLSATIENGANCLVLSTSTQQQGKIYYLSLYLLGCTGSWNQPERSGDICTKEINTKEFIKVGEWSGIGMFTEMKIYSLGVYVTSRLDPSMVASTTENELIHLPHINFENAEVPENTELYQYIKAVDRLCLDANRK